MADQLNYTWLRLDQSFPVEAGLYVTAESAWTNAGYGLRELRFHVTWLDYVERDTYVWVLYYPYRFEQYERHQGFVLADKVRREYAKDAAATKALLTELMEMAKAYDLSAL